MNSDVRIREHCVAALESDTSRRSAAGVVAEQEAPASGERQPAGHLGMPGAVFLPSLLRSTATADPSPDSAVAAVVTPTEPCVAYQEAQQLWLHCRNSVEPIHELTALRSRQGALA
jgi:hypothetical protein